MMKFLFSIILLAVGTNCFSQDNHFDTQKILLCNDSTRITINVKVIKSAGNDNASNTIFCITQNNDSSFDNIEKLTPIYKVKINFSFDEGKMDGNIVSTLTKYLQHYIFDTLKKEQPSIFAKNNLFYGANDGAIIALNMALQNPEKINKTAVYFTDYAVSPSLSNYLNEDAAKLKGKLFVFTKSLENKIVVLDVLILTLALKSTAMFYRIDDFDKATDSADTMGYKWLLADGNNIILKTEY